MWGVGVLLGNAYIIYKTSHIYIWCTDKKEIMSQYEFRRSVALAYILNDTIDSRRTGTGTPSATSVSTRSNDGTGSKYSSSVAESRSRRWNEKGSIRTKIKAVRFNDKTLNPITGSLSNRLNPIFSHLPVYGVEELDKESLSCQLHRWTNRKIE